VQIGGPTGAFIPIIYGIVVEYGVQNLLVATMLAGAMLVAMGVFRLGNLIRFIPKTVVIGFTNGIAVVIFLAQIKDFLGLRIDHLPGEFFGKMKAAHHPPGHRRPPHRGPGLGGLHHRAAVMEPAGPTLQPPAPPARPAGRAGARHGGQCLLHLPVETIGSRFNGIPQDCPPLRCPALPGPPSAS
jgi:SulP family sulfate permease